MKVLDRVCLLLVVGSKLGLISCEYSNPHFVDNRGVIVHLFEWKWDDVANECETFLQHKGYGGVQVSPPSENVIMTGRPWWERYQPVSYLINTRSGDEAAFKRMTRRCNAVGVRIYADAVINHMAATNGKGTAGSISDYTNKKYPAVPYGPEDFHANCQINNYQDAGNVRNCQLVGLPDLNQSREYVRSKIAEYLNHLIDLGVAGFRIDAAKHMWPEDIKAILSRLKNLNTGYGFAQNSRPFVYQEVIDYGGESVKSSDYISTGSVTEFKYTGEISRVFQGNDKLTYLSNWGEGWGFMDRNLNPIVFVDNHDTQRENGRLTYKKSKQYKMANAFMLAHPYGIPKVMSSFYFDRGDQGPPHDQNFNLIPPKINPDNTCSNGYVCEHRWRQIYNMAIFRKTVTGTPIQNWWSNGDQQIAFCRGNKGFVAFNNGGDLRRKLRTCLPKGEYCDVISGNLENGRCTGKVVSVRDNGDAEIVLMGNESDGVLTIHVGTKKV